MTCNNDKKKAFLNNPKARNRLRIIEQQRTADKSQSRENGKTLYVARILALPREEAATSNITNESGTTVSMLVKVRVEPIDNSLPDPSQENLDENTTIVSINMHRDAFVPQNLTGLKSGDLVQVLYDSPPMNNGTFNNNVGPPTIYKKIRSDQQYYETIISNLGQGQSKLSKLGDAFERTSNLTSDDIKAREAKHWTGATLKNGYFDDWPNATKDFLKNQTVPDITYQGGSIMYTPTDSADFTQKAQFNVNKGLYSKIDGVDGQDVGFTKGESYEILSWDYSLFGDIFFPDKPTSKASISFITFLISHFRAWGTKIQINYPHRTIEKQLEFYNTFQSKGAPVAAYPGTSNHGWAMALDLSLGINRITGYNTQKRRGLLSFVDNHSKWVHSNITGFSIEEGRGVNEPWHMSFTKASRKAAFPSWQY